jgi:hypothetical protein
MGINNWKARTKGAATHGLFLALTSCMYLPRADTLIALAFILQHSLDHLSHNEIEDQQSPARVIVYEYCLQVAMANQVAMAYVSFYSLHCPS